jgi:hypothetical protein
VDEEHGLLSNYRVLEVGLECELEISVIRNCVFSGEIPILPRLREVDYSCERVDLSNVPPKSSTSRGIIQFDTASSRIVISF